MKNMAEKLEEAFAVLCDTNRKGGIVGHDSPHENKLRPCPACENIRALALAVLDEFQFSEMNYTDFRRQIEEGTL